MTLRKMFVYQEYPKNLMKLYEIAYNLWWSWDYEALGLFNRADTQLFRAVNHNPIKLLHSLPRERIETLSNDRGFLFELDKVWRKFQEYMKYTATLEVENSEKYGISEKNPIACFVMECGVHESLPIYAGGLGVLCGDLFKAGSDMGLPVVGVGLLYKYGYFNQRIASDGQQQEEYVEFENHLEPMKEVRGQEGEPVYVSLDMLDEWVRIKLWQVDIGQTRLILLDTDIEDNPPHLRDITHELYVADKPVRLQQELILGLGGLRALDALSIEPAIYHINEAHSALAIVGRLERLIKEKGFSFQEARAVIRSSTVFTTHTPVLAGNESFETQLLEKFVKSRLEALGVSFADFAALGVVEQKRNVFWLPAMAIRSSGFVNAVSRQHAEVSRRMWSTLYPERHIAEIPIDYVTNGVHSSWVSQSFDHVFSRYMGPDYWRAAREEGIWERVLDIPPEEIWEAHHENKKILVPFVREKIAAGLSTRGYSDSRRLKLASLLNPDYLTVVFARRFAYYKRATLILKDRARLREILTNSERPVQLIFAGKAHPADEAGKNMIKEIIDFAREYNIEDRVTFLENHDMNMARHLVWGADVWLNTPLKEREGCGTSGMKAAINGVLNLSVLQGWWRECFNEVNGWAITAGELYTNPDLQEEAEAEQIYNLLEEEIVERFYTRNDAGVPESWVEMIKQSIYSVGYEFTMRRVLTDYMRKLFMPALEASRAVARDDHRPLKEALAEEADVLKWWSDVKVTSFFTSADKRDHLDEGEKIEAECRVRLGEAPPEIFKIELFYLYNQERDYKLVPMQLLKKESGEGHYACSFHIQGYGIQGVNVRIKPAGQFVEELHPELIKWAS